MLSTSDRRQVNLELGGGKFRLRYYLRVTLRAHSTGSSH
jgi:hypothetical protein